MTTVGLLDVRGLHTEIPTPDGPVRAVDGVSFHIEPGEAVALVGESGSGKTMTAMSLVRLVPSPGQITAGKITFAGRDLRALGDAALRRVRGGDIGIVFQDPLTYLNPLMRVGEQIAETLHAHTSIGRRESREAAIDALRLVRIPSPERIVDSYPHQLSGGMRQRVVIAIAICCRPRLLIADEPTTALDVTIQAQIMRLLSDLRRDVGNALLLITHDLALVAEYCDRVYVMYAGRIVEHASTLSLFREPKHPYTKALLRSSLTVDRKLDRFQAIQGQPPSLIHPPDGCRFRPRCESAMPRCAAEPPLFEIADRRVACWLHDGSA